MENDKTENSVASHGSTAISEFFRSIGFTVAIIGWIWFGSLWWLKLSGATIYATTRSEIIEVIDPQWDSLVIQPQKGSGFSVKIQGMRP